MAAFAGCNTAGVALSKSPELEHSSGALLRWQREGERGLGVSASCPGLCPTKRETQSCSPRRLLLQRQKRRAATGIEGRVPPCEWHAINRETRTPPISFPPRTPPWLSSYFVVSGTFGFLERAGRQASLLLHRRD